MPKPKLRKCQNNAINTFNIRSETGETQTNLSLCTGSGKTRIIQELTQNQRKIIIVFPWLTLLSQFWNDKHNPFKKHKCVRYFATEGTLREVKRLDTEMDELNAPNYVILTTYTSAPEVYQQLLAKEGRSVELLIHDEAHRVTREQYTQSLASVQHLVAHRVDLSATLPIKADYKYSLLRGIKDKVVRDFNMEIFLCTDAERSQSKLFVEIVENLLQTHPKVKLLVYTAEANTDTDTSSSVKTYLNQNMAAAAERGWWMKGLYEDTMSERENIMAEFQEPRNVSILVSCRTISEGVDLKNANCMMPWDASQSPIDNIQRIGRVLRLYKDDEGHLRPEDDQLPSTVFIPVFLTKSKFAECGGNRENIHDVLGKEIELNEKGNFMPFVTVCSALKDELADEDEELFNQLINFPPKLKYTRNAVECLAKHLKKPAEQIREEMCDLLEHVVAEDEDEDQDEDVEDEIMAEYDYEEAQELVETMMSNDWDEEQSEDVMNILAKSQGLTLVVDDGENIARYGDGEEYVVLKKNEKDDGYKVAKGEKAERERKALARVSNRSKVGFSSDCSIMLSLDEADSDLATTEKNFVATKLSARVQPDADWEKRKTEADEFYKKNTRKASQGSKNPEERRIGSWIIHQRTNKKKGRLSQERINSLEAMEWWVWDKDERWEDAKVEADEFYKKNRKIASHHSKNLEERRIGSWIIHQRTNKKNGTISPERINSLVAIEWWVWDKDEQWEDAKVEADEFYKKNRKFASAGSKNPEERRIGSWISTQRTNKKKGKLSQERIDSLEAMEWWVWDNDERWEDAKVEADEFYKKNGKFASQKSKNPEERRIGQWISNQRTYKKNGKLSQERIKTLDAMEWWVWVNDERWEDSKVEADEFYKKNRKIASAMSKNPEERRPGHWISNQRTYKKKGKLSQERIDSLEAMEWWVWEANKPKKQTETINTPSPSQSPTPENTIVKRVPKRKLVIKEPAQTEKTYRNCSRPKSSKLTDFHRRFKHMKSTNYNATNVSREDFDEYHQEADKHDARDTQEVNASANVLRLLREVRPNCDRKSYHAIDLGCGMNRFRKRDGVSKMSWTSLDIYAVDDTVTIGNIGNMEDLYEDEEFDVIIANRVLWGTDHDAMLSEIQRIVKTGGVVVFCEAVGRWAKKSEDKKTNILPSEIEKSGLVITKQEGTQIDADGSHDLWQYVVATKQ